MLGILEKGGRDHLMQSIVKSGANFEKCIAGKHFMKLFEGISKTLVPAKTSNNDKNQGKQNKKEIEWF